MKMAKAGNIDFLGCVLNLRQEMRAMADGLDVGTRERRYATALCIAGHDFLRTFSDRPEAM